MASMDRRKLMSRFYLMVDRITFPSTQIGALANGRTAATAANDAALGDLRHGLRQCRLAGVALRRHPHPGHLRPLRAECRWHAAVQLLEPVLGARAQAAHAPALRSSEGGEFGEVSVQSVGVDHGGVVRWSFGVAGQASGSTGPRTHASLRRW